MSYVRWSDDSDVYVYMGGAKAYNGRNYDVLVCCACRLNPTGDPDWPDDVNIWEKPSRKHSDKHRRVMYDDMIGHLEAHRAAGHKVPQYAIDRLVAERDGQ